MEWAPPCSAVKLKISALLAAAKLAFSAWYSKLCRHLIA